MYKVNIHDAKAGLSALLERVAAGERILICNRNRPVAELAPVEAARKEPRPFGLARGLVAVPATFFEPLSDDELDAFEGLGRAGSGAPFATRVHEGASRPYAPTSGGQPAKVRSRTRQGIGRGSPSPRRAASPRGRRR